MGEKPCPGGHGVAASSTKIRLQFYARPRSMRAAHAGNNIGAEKMYVPVVFDITNANNDLVPPGLDRQFFHSFGLLLPHLSQSQTDDPNGARAACRLVTDRYAIGAAEIWKTFPELRKEFLVQVNRLGTPESTPVVRLREVISGDEPIGGVIHYGSQVASGGFRIVQSIPMPGDISNDIPALLDEFALAAPLDITGRRIVFVDRFSIKNGWEFLPGCNFLSARAIIQNTNMNDLLDEMARRPFHPHRPPTPVGFSGAMVFAPTHEAEEEFAKATTSRILALCAMQGVNGRALGSLVISRGGHGAAIYGEEWSRPYAEGAPYYESFMDEGRVERIKWCLELIYRSTAKKYFSAKEDYRLLSLDTVEDSRHSHVPELRFAQIWMAIERLFAVKAEISTTLSLSLSALSVVEQRYEEYRRIKKSYDLRSKIVHGYDFIRGQHVYDQVNDMAEIYRKIFHSAASFSRPEDYSSAMLQHAISGMPSAFT